jgi:hypothetical protein
MALIMDDYNLNGTPIRYISGGRELRWYCGYWHIRLSDREMGEWPGVHWHRWVLFHKWKYWTKYGEWYGRDEATYRYLDKDPDNIRITNIGVLLRSGEWA